MLVEGGAAQASHVVVRICECLRLLQLVEDLGVGRAEVAVLERVLRRAMPEEQVALQTDLDVFGRPVVFFEFAVILS